MAAAVGSSTRAISATGSVVQACSNQLRYAL